MKLYNCIATENDSEACNTKWTVCKNDEIYFHIFDSIVGDSGHSPPSIHQQCLNCGKSLDRLVETQAIDPFLIARLC